MAALTENRTDEPLATHSTSLSDPMRPVEPAPLTYANGRGGTSLESVFQARGVGCALVYRGSLRAGTITYVEGDLAIAFRYAQGGRACRFFIELPDAGEWERVTGTALARRDDIVDFLAETVRREEAGSWRYTIGPTRIQYD